MFWTLTRASLVQTAWGTRHAYRACSVQVSYSLSCNCSQQAVFPYLPWCILEHGLSLESPPLGGSGRLIPRAGRAGESGNDVYSLAIWRDCEGKKSGSPARAAVSRAPVSRVQSPHGTFSLFLTALQAIFFACPPFLPHAAHHRYCSTSLHLPSAPHPDAVSIRARGLLLGQQKGFRPHAICGTLFL